MPTINYYLEIHTRDKFGAGTDNDVYITVFGEEDGIEKSSGEINLSSQINGNAFERNDTHKLDFQWEDLGRPTKIKLRLGNTFLDDWEFDWCTLKRSSPDQTDVDINKTVTFRGPSVFKRKDSKLYNADLGVLREIVINTENKSQNGGTQFITLPANSEKTITTSFIEETMNVIEHCVITRNGTEHSVSVGGEFGYSPGQKGWSGKVTASYGFKYSTLSEISDRTTTSIRNATSTTDSITIRNSGKTVSEYIEAVGENKKNIVTVDGKEQNYAIVYETSIVEVTRQREGASTITKRVDTLNLGKRVRAILPLIDQDDQLKYITASGKTYTKNQLWDAVKP